MLIQGAIAQGLTSNLYKQSTKLNEEQTAKVAELLSHMGTGNLKDSTAQTVVAEAKELRLISNADLAAALAEAGIDTSELSKQTGQGLMGRPESPPPPPPPPQESKGIATVDEAIVELIAQAVEDYDVSQEEETTLGEAVLATLEEAGYDSSQPLIDFYS
ncbi:MAG: hypothetical protein BM560_08580 [Roseobacter sp. MedPE-SWde]|nr:MAG: hypothetical protein BM560_08580 [Roseobacter sp. MedPE-SWde]